MLKNIFLILLSFVLLGIAIIFLPIDKINWGRISILPAATITVTGTSQSDVANQTAGFSATITSTNADKQKATDDVNTKMTALIKSIKDFGIADADIKTESVNVYQQTTTMMYPLPPQPAGNGLPAQAGDWTASNSIAITLRDVSKTSGISDILNKSGATNVYGPNLGVASGQTATDSVLLSKAVADARQKADAIAKAGGQTLGHMINVQEGGSNYPIPMMYATKDSAGSGTPIQPGTSTLSKSVTVVFELK